MKTQSSNGTNYYMKGIAYLTLGLTIGVLFTTIWLNHIDIKAHLEEGKNEKK